MSLGTLTVDLIANIAKFESDMGRAAKLSDKRAKEIAKSIDEAAKLTVTAFAAVGGAVALGLKKAIDEADALSKAAQKVGVDVENLSKLKYAGALSDVEFDSLTSALGKLNKASVAAAEGSKEQAEAFGRLGVSVTDQNGKLKSTNEILYEVADAYERTADDAAKSANSMAIFGKAGADLIPLLNGGSAGLREMGAEAEQLGLVLSDKAAKSAEQFNDNLTRVQSAGQGLFVQLADSLLPTLTRISDEFADTAKQADGFESTVKTLDSGVRVVASGFIVVSAGIQSAGQALGGFIAAAQKVGESGAFNPLKGGLIGAVLSKDGRAALASSVDILGQSYADVVQINSDALTSMGTLWDEQGKKIEVRANAAADAAKRLQAATQASIGINTLQGRIKSGASAKEGTLGVDKEQIARLTREYERLTGASLGAAKASIGFSANTDKAKGSADKLAKSLEDMREAGRKHTEDMLSADSAALDKQLAQQAEFQKMTQRAFDLQGLSPEDQSRLGGMMDAEDQYNDQLTAIADFYANKKGLEDEANAASEAALIEYNNRVNALNQSRAETDTRVDAEAKQLQLLQGLSFAQSALALIGNFTGQSKTARIALLAFEKAVAIAEIVINTQVAASKAGAQLGIFGIPAAAAIQALGAAQIGLVIGTGIAEAGGRAAGGKTNAGSLYEVGEGNRAELYRSKNKTYLIPGNAGGEVIPARAANDSLGGRATTPQNIRIVNAFDTAVIGDYLGSSDGERAILNVMQRNGSRIRNIAGGG